MQKGKVLGIDPGLNKTGYAIITRVNENFKLIKSGVFYSKSEVFENKIFEIVIKIEDLIKQDSPTLLAIEDIFRGLNTKSALKSAHLKGAITYTAIKYKIPVKVISATEAKQIVTGYGRAEKEQVKKNLNLFIENLPESLKEDESDAIAIAISSFFL